jgi:hypothetical protein
MERGRGEEPRSESILCEYKYGKPRSEMICWGICSSFLLSMLPMLFVVSFFHLYYARQFCLLRPSNFEFPAYREQMIRPAADLHIADSR